LLLHGKRRSWGRSKKYFDACLELNPQHGDALFNRAALKLQKQDLDGAMNDLNTYVVLNPQDPEGFQNRGFTKLQTGDTQGALQDFDSAIAIQPNNYGVLNNRANLVLNVLNDPKRAIADVDRAIQLEPNIYVAYKTRGCINLSMRNFEGAILDFNYCLSLNPPEHGEIQDLLEEAIHETRGKTKQSKPKKKR